MKVDPKGNGEFLVTPADIDEARIIAEASYEALMDVVRASAEGDSPLDKKTAASLIYLANKAAVSASFEVNDYGREVLKGVLRMFYKRGHFVEEMTSASELGAYTEYQAKRRQKAGQMLGDLATAPS